MLPAAGPVHRLAQLPPTLFQGQTNDCGPYALAAAATSLLSSEVVPSEAARRLRLLRVPLLGATLPWGFVRAAQALGLRARGHWLGRLEDLKRAVDGGSIAAVIVHPDDWGRIPWNALHYRLIVGYRDDPGLPGGGELYFACSGTPTAALPDGRPGNVAVPYARFRAQWHTYLTPRWYAVLSRKGSIG